jgi:hypothetical protein
VGNSDKDDQISRLKMANEEFRVRIKEMENLAAQAYKKMQDNKKVKPLTHRDDPVPSKDYQDRKQLLIAL